MIPKAEREMYCFLLLTFAASFSKNIQSSHVQFPKKFLKLPNISQWQLNLSLIISSKNIVKYFEAMNSYRLIHIFIISLKLKKLKVEDGVLKDFTSELQLQHSFIKLNFDFWRPPKCEK